MAYKINYNTSNMSNDYQGCPICYRYTCVCPSAPTAPYSVVVRDPNSWSAATGIHQELAKCGHKHKTVATAQACYDRLTAWRDGSTSARWYHAKIEGSNGEVVNV